ncbi:MAG: ATP-binding protein [Nanoarchaeota archaeon]|nr:ATP-binding protein [Nanoarchaeota archaeon]
MTKRRNSAFSKTFRYLLLSTGKGASGTIGLFGKIKPREKKEYQKEIKPVSERAPAKGKISHTPSFSDLEVEKLVSGDYAQFKQILHEDSKIILIFGRRGSGKSALGLRIMENIQAQTERNCYALGIHEKFIPSWIQSIDSIEKAQPESVILVDEGAVSFSSRESMRDTNKELSRLMAIARHKNLTLVFITQNTGMIDKNVLKLADSLMIKEGSLLQLEMERPEMKKFYMKAKEFIDKGEDNKMKYFYLIDSDFEGLLSYSLPSFWTTQLSKNKL